MKKLKLFLENFLIYGFGGIISKLIPLIMVPIVTRIMPSSDYYGISDLSNTIVSFGSAIAIMGMYDAMYRMFFEKDDDSFKVTVCSTAFLFTCSTSAIVFLLMLLFKNQIASWFFGSGHYAYVVYLSAIATLVGATNGIISAPTRMQNKRKVYLVMNAVGPILSYSVAISLLLSGYYVVALPLAGVIAGACNEIAFAVMNRKWFNPKRFDVGVLKQLLVIAIPLLPNFIIYWVFNSCDKLMITNMIGLGAAGIYSVGSKLGHASQLIYTAFAGGWQYFAFSTMKEENQVQSNSHVFEYLGVISYAVTALMCAWSRWIFGILFNADYLSGFIIAPYLFLAPLLQMLYQVAVNQFLVIKKTWPSLLILSSGALINIALNYYLIPILGIEGAAIATLLGYVVAVICCSVALCHMQLMVISRRFMLSTALLVLYMLLWRFRMTEALGLSMIMAMLVSAIIALLYRSELTMLYQGIKGKNPKKNSAKSSSAEEKKEALNAHLRPLRKSDAPFMFEWMHDLRVVEYLRTDFKTKSLEDCKVFIDQSQDAAQNLHMAICNESDEYMGTVSLKHLSDEFAEFAITMRSCAMGKGYAEYGMREILRKGFETVGLQEIFWCVSSENRRAVRFYDKNGYKRISSNRIPDSIRQNYSVEEVSSYIWYSARRTERKDI